MLILPSQYPLCYTLWIRRRCRALFHLQHHYDVLARWSCFLYKYDSYQCSQADHASRVFLRQHSNSCLQWVSWLQPLQRRLTSTFYLLQKVLESVQYTLTTGPGVITVHSYNRSWSQYSTLPAGNSALLLKTSNVKLVNSSFHSNLGTALVVNNTSTVESSFTYNKCRCKSFSEMSELGCGVIAISSTLTFTGNTSFHQAAYRHTYSFYWGGAIWVSASSLDFNGTNNFLSNSHKQYQKIWWTVQLM